MSRADQGDGWNLVHNSPNSRWHYWMGVHAVCSDKLLECNDHRVKGPTGWLCRSCTKALSRRSSRR